MIALSNMTMYNNGNYKVSMELILWNNFHTYFNFSYLNKEHMKLVLTKDFANTYIFI